MITIKYVYQSFHFSHRLDHRQVLIKIMNLPNLGCCFVSFLENFPDEPEALPLKSPAAAEAVTAGSTQLSDTFSMF